MPKPVGFGGGLHNSETYIGGTAMSKHGTASEGRVLEFALTVARNAPRDLPVEIMDIWDNQGEQMKQRLREALVSGPVIKEPTAVSQSVETSPVPVTIPVAPGFPAIVEEFELPLDGDDPANDPMEMVRRDGYGSPEKWKHKGERISGKQTGRFKLVGVGYCRNLDEVRQKLAVHDEIPGGQWREAYKAKFRGDCGRPVGVADPSWVPPVGHADFPCVGGRGRSFFGWPGHGFHDDWLWLVACK